MKFAIVICELFSVVAIESSFGIPGCGRGCGLASVVWSTGAYGSEFQSSSLETSMSSTENVGIAYSWDVKLIAFVRSLDSESAARCREPER